VSLVHHAARGRSHGRLRGLRALVLFGLGFFILSGIGSAISAAVAPRTKALCLPYRPCGMPPVAPATTNESAWRSRRYGYVVHYPGDEATPVQRTAAGVVLETQLQDSSTAAIIIEGGQVPADRAIRDQVSSLSALSAVGRDSSPARQILGASVGYQPGLGVPFVGDLAAPQGVQQPVSIASESATRAGLTITATVIGSPHDSGPNSFLYQLADQIINTVTWPGSAG
jgi:hypothetical protein